MHKLVLPNPETPSSLFTNLSRLPYLLYRALRWNSLHGGWLWPYLRRHRSFDRCRLPANQPINVMVLFADHFEPAKRYGDLAATTTVRSSCAENEEIAGRHRDADGRPPQHTWFYRYDYPHAECAQTLSESVFRGFGEIEFHLHRSDPRECFYSSPSWKIAPA